ncbi:ATPase, T2SS/T4P/T4SS family, partial [Bartonella sp. AC66GZZY]|uniref:ATPase, T2SS/T4P/T4SS family n=1 Tax=Bartonella sp. AC66GZZY TaxID=3243458 RepID=UPI0035CEB57D
MPSAKNAERASIVLTKLKILDDFLNDENLFEIVVNRPGEVIVEGPNGWQTHILKELTYSELEVVAAYTTQKISVENPVLSATLPNNERIQIVMPPAVAANTISMTIRKPSSRTFSLESLHENNLFSVAQNTSFTPTQQMTERLSELSDTEKELTDLFIAKDF